jgi:hypothetical protein
VVETGHDGRLWLAASPQDPNRLWGSKSGDPFNFAVGENANDAIDVVLTTKGALRWLAYAKNLLAGGESGEYSVKGSDGLLAPGNVYVEGESVFGGAALPAVMVGDQVLFVDKDRRTVRALSYSYQDGGWVAQPITFTADHLTRAGIREIHFAGAPDPTLLAVMLDGSLAACVYDRAAKLSAWYRIDVGAPVRSAAVVHEIAGDVFWLSVQRPAGIMLERLPLHEVGVQYLDAYVTGTTSGPTITGLAHLEGQLVRVTLDGAVAGPVRVAGGQVTVDAEVGQTYCVGLAYRAAAITLPLEGGNPAGTSQGLKVHYSDLAVRVNNSAAPKIQGTRAGMGRPFSTPLGDEDPLTSGDLKVKSMRVEEGGCVTIEQDAPFRTEVCAIYGQAHISNI